MPAFYQDARPTVASGCNGQYQAPYRLPDSVMTTLPSSIKTSLYVIHYFDEVQSRIKQEVEYEEVEFVNAKSIGDGNNNLKSCVLLVPAQEDMIVVDKDGKIRGYYVSTDREDVDRFLLELEILLKKY